MDRDLKDVRTGLQGRGEPPEALQERSDPLSFCVFLSYILLLQMLLVLL